ncbi:hypothetical protein [Streptomyces spongiae]|uniref:hypothetical protein n=1 Tax=Streptomyces spongiae TaxID=565072 RepID=UPI0018833214|nr:hypothetical protein [Streptomyces spongiae]
MDDASVEHRHFHLRIRDRVRVQVQQRAVQRTQVRDLALSAELLVGPLRGGLPEQRAALEELTWMSALWCSSEPPYVTQISPASNALLAIASSALLAPSSGAEQPAMASAVVAATPAERARNCRCEAEEEYGALVMAGLSVGSRPDTAASDVRLLPNRKDPGVPPRHP